MSFSGTGFVYTYRLGTKWLLPRAGERINRGIATSQSICPCSTLPRTGVDSINTLFQVNKSRKAQVITKVLEININFETISF